MSDEEPKKYALILANLDYILVDPSERKLQTYLEIGWDETNARAYVGNPKNWDQIASFNTPYVTFSASSRRNRFYEIFWKDDYFAYDQLYPGAGEILNDLVQRFNVIVLTSRTEDMKEKTLARLEEIGVPVADIEFNFKGTLDPLPRFKAESIKNAAEKYQMGLALVHQPTDIDLCRKYSLTLIGLTTTNSREEFYKADAVCADWVQIVAVLNTVQ
ncbi:MAG TPA: HAD family hydrolase [Candidatus Lokiarchaeia archaeon]|nr:HAD family hydrolase [Candidatus Lokiarchaeia archaeon]